MSLDSPDPPPVYPPISNGAFEVSPRGRLTSAAVAAAVILVIDAVVALAGTFAVAVPIFFAVLVPEFFPGRSNTGIAVMAFTAALALACPAVAVLVSGVRTRGAYVTGVVTTAAVAVTVAGEAAFWLEPAVSALTAGAGIVFAGNLVALFLLIGLLRPVSAEEVPGARS